MRSTTHLLPVKAKHRARKREDPPVRPAFWPRPAWFGLGRRVYRLAAGPAASGQWRESRCGCSGCLSCRGRRLACFQTERAGRELGRCRREKRPRNGSSLDRGGRSEEAAGPPAGTDFSVPPARHLPPPVRPPGRKRGEGGGHFPGLFLSLRGSPPKSSFDPGAPARLCRPHLEARGRNGLRSAWHGRAAAS